MNLYKENSHAHSIAWSTWHFEWCTKYRYKVFRQDYIKNYCLTALYESAKRNKIEILEIEVDVDHVHLMVSIPTTMSPSKAIGLLKGFSSKIIFKLIPKLRLRYPNGHLWSRGKFMASVGHITLENVKKYLEDHHAKKRRESPLRSEAEQASAARPFRVERRSNIKTNKIICK